MTPYRSPGTRSLMLFMILMAVPQTPGVAADPVRPLADEFVAVFKSPDPERICCSSPGLARCPSGRLIATLDLSGPGLADLPGPKGEDPSDDKFNQGRIFVSDDHGKPTRRHWLLSTQATDSMTRADRLPPERFELPNNERHRLQLHFSKNCIDWCFAGMVTIGPAVNQSRHYASMVIDGDDLHILSRTGDRRANSAHNCNIISFHTIRNFRRLVY